VNAKAALNRAKALRELALRHGASELAHDLGDAIDHVRRARRLRPSCCEVAEPTTSGESRAPVVQGLELEDHNADSLTFDAFFRGKPTIVIFFYTRCDNPEKCSLSVTKLARIQKQLAARGLSDRIRTAAITYDPGFDGPERIRNYMFARGCLLDSNHRGFRAPNMASLRQSWRLGVNYVGSLVNRHRIEAYVLDHTGRVRKTFTRLKWDVDEVVLAALALQEPPVRRGLLASNALLSLALVLLPKCPLCWAAYLSVLGTSWLPSASSIPIIFWILVALLVLNLVVLRPSDRRGLRTLPWLMMTAGVCWVVLSSRLGAGNAVGIVGCLAVLSASVAHVVSVRRRERSRSSRIAAIGDDIAV
jgi:protein SCO1